jgi:hypothetical protein
LQATPQAWQIVRENIEMNKQDPPARIEAKSERLAHPKAAFLLKK